MKTIIAGPEKFYRENFFAIIFFECNFLWQTNVPNTPVVYLAFLASKNDLLSFEIVYSTRSL